MTRTTIRHTLSAVAILALVALVVSGPASAGHKNKGGCYAGGQCLNPITLDHSGLVSQGISSNTANGLATKNPLRHRTTRILSGGLDRVIGGPYSGH